MFKNKIKKQKKFDILEQNDHGDDNNEDDNDEFQNQIKKKVKTDTNQTSTKDLANQYKTQTEQMQDNFKYQAKRGDLSSAGGNAYAENEIDTSADQDSKAIALRNIKISKDIRSGKLNKKFYHGVNQDYLGRTEQQIAGKKYTGTCGPLRAPTNIRVTCRFDYNPSLCKDWHDTGYCVFGDSCIYIHDRGDYKTGWEMDKEYEDEQKFRQQGKQNYQNVEEQEEQDIEIPKICQICDNPLKNAIVTRCEHYFCEKCALDNHKTNSNCFICYKPTNGIFNDAVQIIKKLKDQKRQMFGRKLSSDEEGDDKRNQKSNKNEEGEDGHDENNDNIVINNEQQEQDEKEDDDEQDDYDNISDEDNNNNEKVGSKKSTKNNNQKQYGEEKNEKKELEKLSKEFQKKQQQQKVKNVSSTSDWQLV